MVRRPVENLLELLATGMTIDEIIEDHPDLERDDLLAALEFAARAETELRATGARPRRTALRGIEALTPSERRVAELAAKGPTNREIAQTLFVTQRTVEVHLTSVYRKLDIDSRSQLAAALGEPTRI